MTTNESTASIGFGVVVIGRNEGERLKACLESISSFTGKLVYVDSGSTDDSIDLALALGVTVVELDMSVPFTAGRARNAGFEHLKSTGNLPDYVQFIDGDCMLNDSWLSTGGTFLSNHDDVALLCGVRKEIYPERTIYNFLCDLEWDGPKGDIRESGGDFLVRSVIFDRLNGFDEKVIAGEEPELCFRIRSEGYSIYRLDVAMTHHDANMTTASQWWGRSVRSGHAYANIAHLHFKSTEKIYQKETKSILFWGVFLPLLFLIGALLSPLLLSFIVLSYFYFFTKIYLHGKKEFNIKGNNAFYYAASVMVGKFPHAYGVAKYIYRVITKKQFSIIEYK